MKFQADTVLFTFEQEAVRPAPLGREGRSWWRVRLLATILTVVMSAFAMVAVALVMVGPGISASTRRRTAPSVA